MVADSRTCEQCGSSFVPRREHARFCSPACRAAWNREHSDDQKAGMSALQWSITAMNGTTRRLTGLAAWDRPRAFAVIGEAVWWVTIVDATLVRHHLDAYDDVMAGQTPAERQRVEETLAGLRFVRNRIGDEADLEEFIEPGDNVQAEGRGVSPAGCGSQYRNRRSRRFPRGGRNGSGRGTAPTRRSLPGRPSARRLAGPRHSSSWPPRTRPPSRLSASMPDAESARSARC